MSIFKRNTAYGIVQSEAAPLSPYDRAKREWDNRIGTARVQAFHWRVVALASLFTSFGLAAGLVYVSANKEVRTFVVEPEIAGQAPRVKLADGVYTPTSAEKSYVVRHVVSLVRVRSLDPVVVRNNWKEAYCFLAGEAILTMNAYAAADPPFRAIDGRPLTRTVAISNVLQKSKRTFQVRWVETDYIGGVEQQPQTFTGLFETGVVPPRDEAQVFRNPLGIYVASFSWSREFTEPVVTDPVKTGSTNTPAPEEIKDESNN